MKNNLVVALFGCASLLAGSAGAATFNFSTASGATESGGNPVDASAVFTPSAGSLSIQLTDLLANPKTVAQLISDLSFSVSGGGDVSGATLTSGTGTERTVNDNGSFTAGGSTDAGFVLSSPSAGTLLLDVLSGPGHAGPEHLIIGPAGGGGTYSAANGSIAGNDPHNPFLFDTVNFTLNIPGLTAESVINNVVFSFGTTAGNDVPGSGGPGGVPDGGTTVLLLGAAMSGLALFRRKLS